MTSPVEIHFDIFEDKVVRRVVSTPPAKDLKNENNPAPVKAPRWKNIYFKKNGVYGLGRCLFPTLDAAKKMAERSVEDLAAGSKFINVVYKFDNGVTVTYPEFSHHMQIPWEKE